MLRSLVYVSRAAPSISNPALLPLVTKAQARNRSLCVTGRLVYLIPTPLASDSRWGFPDAGMM